jgi:hypothetical protein
MSMDVAVIYVKMIFKLRFFINRRNRSDVMHVKDLAAMFMPNLYVLHQQVARR